MKVLGKFFSVLIMLAILALNACDDNEVVVPATNGLLARAGEDQTTQVGTGVLLDGSASHDKNGRSFSFHWTVKTKPATSIATLATPDQNKTTFTPDVAGNYLIELTIKQGSLSATDHVIVTAISNTPGDPVAVIIDEDIIAPTTLTDIFDDPAQADYVVTRTIDVRADLTIAPGVVVHFNDHAGLKITDGAFKAAGTAENPIVLEGYNPNTNWKGVIIYSNDPTNEMKYVSVRDAGSEADYETQVRAAVTLAGSPLSGAALKIINTSIEKSGGFGLFVAGKSTITAFADNHFSQNTTSAVYATANEIHKIDANTTFNGNGFNGIETYGPLNHEAEVEWKKLSNGSYLISNHLEIESGLKIEPGVSFRVRPQTTVKVKGNGYLKSVGTEASRITFTSVATNSYWNGLLINTSSPLNKIAYTDISYAGMTKFPGAEHEGNIVLGPSGKVVIENTSIKFGLGYGVVANTKTQVNADIAAVNAFASLTKGWVFPTILHYPYLPLLTGEWLDYWSFFNGKTGIAPNFYNAATQTWYGGAASPWVMAGTLGMGLHISEDKSYTWTIAEHSPMTGCESYSSEFITGNVTWTDETVMFTEDFWRSRFINSCDASQNVDIDVTPGAMTLSYTITKMFNVSTGAEYWELRFINPDNSTFSLYRNL